MKVHAQPDPVALERALLDAVERAAPAGSVSPLLILVPTTLLVSQKSRVFLTLAVLGPT